MTYAPRLILDLLDALHDADLTAPELARVVDALLLISPDDRAWVEKAGSRDKALRCGIRSVGRGRRKKMPRWAHVKDAFAVGSTSARELCRWADVDPDEEVGGRSS